MEWVETTGRSITEAKENALDQLGVDETDAEFEIVGDVRTGLFGRVKVEARVRARVRPTSPRPKEGDNRRGRRGDNRRERPARQASEGPQGEEQKPAAKTQQRERKPRTKKTKSNPRPEAQAVAEQGALKMDEHVPLSQQADVAEGFLAGLFDRLDQDVDINVATDEDDEIVSVAMAGDRLGYLIGPRGSTLHSLQEVTRTVVQRKTGARNGRIIVDVAQYREKRREALARFSRQVADEVLSSREPRTLEPMNPGDRKVVHDVINTIDGVITTSEGEEPRRRVVIKPANGE